MREKLGSGWVGQAPTRILIFLENFVCCFHVTNLFFLIDNGVSGCCLTNPSFSRIFGIILT